MILNIEFTRENKNFSKIPKIFLKMWQREDSLFSDDLNDYLHNYFLEIKLTFIITFQNEFFNYGEILI